MEMLKNKYQEDDTQLTFKPDINKKSKNIKRSVNDLYVVNFFEIKKSKTKII